MIIRWWAFTAVGGTRKGQAARFAASKPPDLTYPADQVDVLGS